MRAAISRPALRTRGGRQLVHDGSRHAATPAARRSDSLSPGGEVAKSRRGAGAGRGTGAIRPWLPSGRGPPPRSMSLRGPSPARSGREGARPGLARATASRHTSEADGPSPAGWLRARAPRRATLPHFRVVASRPASRDAGADDRRVTPAGRPIARGDCAGRRRPSTLAGVGSVGLASAAHTGSGAIVTLRSGGREVGRGAAGSGAAGRRRCRLAGGRAWRGRGGAGRSRPGWIPTDGQAFDRTGARRPFVGWTRTARPGPPGPGCRRAVLSRTCRSGRPGHAAG